MRTRSRPVLATASTLIALLLSFLPFDPAAAPPALASHGDPHATIRTWAVGADPDICGLDPHETTDDVTALTNHVGAPTMVSFMENTNCGFCGILYWNPVTNLFKSYGVTGGFNFAGDIDRRTPSGAPMTFGGGDAWSAVNGNNGFSPYMNFRGSDDFRRWDLSAFSSTAIRLHPTNGKVYMGDFSGQTFTGGQIVELDPATNMVRKWTTGNSPYSLVVDDTFVWATGVANFGKPDEILRLDPATGELTRWAVPGGGFQAFVSFGAPNSITKDLDGNILFTESASNEVGRLNPTTNMIDEYTKAGIFNTQAIASSGTGAALQAFFTERGDLGLDPGHISLITLAAATPTTTAVTPTMEDLVPSSFTATPIDFDVQPTMATITPAVFDSPGVDPSGIVRFPIPPGTTAPTGMTRVAFPSTVFGSMEGNDHVFELVSEEAIPAICGDNAVNQAGEECDGIDDQACPGQCIAPGQPGECTCSGLPGATPTPTATPTPSITPTPGALNHFQCYAVHREGKRFGTIFGVTLNDQLGPGIVEVRRLKRLCNPASKNGEDPDAPLDPDHLVGHEIKQQIPRFRKLRGVRIEDQFGTLAVDVIRPMMLLVPTAKSLLGPPPPLAPPAVDHFKCYHVKRARLRRSGDTIQDQFGSLRVDVKRPKYLCVPADKNGSGIMNGTDHLTCYQVRPARPFPRPGGVFINNQFGENTIRVTRPTELCLPSLKTLPAP
jgi:hypothetical protein